MSKQVLVGNKVIYQEKKCSNCGSAFTTIENADLCIKCRGSGWVNGYLYPDVQVDFIHNGGFLICYRNRFRYGRDGWEHLLCLDEGEYLDKGVVDGIGNLDMLNIVEVRDLENYSYFSIGFDGHWCETPLFLFGRDFKEAEVLWNRFYAFSNNRCGYIYGPNHGLKNWCHINYETIDKENPFYGTDYESFDIDYSKTPTFYGCDKWKKGNE